MPHLVCQGMSSNGQTLSSTDLSHFVEVTVFGMKQLWETLEMRDKFMTKELYNYFRKECVESTIEYLTGNIRELGGDNDVASSDEGETQQAASDGAS